MALARDHQHVPGVRVRDRLGDGLGAIGDRPYRRRSGPLRLRALGAIDPRDPRHDLGDDLLGFL